MTEPAYGRRSRKSRPSERRDANLQAFVEHVHEFAKPF